MFCVCATARGGERRPPGQLSAVDGQGAPEEGLWRQAVSAFIQDFTGRRNLGAPLLHSQVSWAATATSNLKGPSGTSGGSSLDSGVLGVQEVTVRS